MNSLSLTDCVVWKDGEIQVNRHEVTAKHQLQRKNTIHSPFSLLKLESCISLHSIINSINSSTLKKAK